LQCDCLGAARKCNLQEKVNAVCQEILVMWSCARNCVQVRERKNVTWVHIGHFFTPHTLFVIAITIRKRASVKRDVYYDSQNTGYSCFLYRIHSFMY
jgi:hypothetical protein